MRHMSSSAIRCLMCSQLDEQLYGSVCRSALVAHSLRSAQLPDSTAGDAKLLSLTLMRIWVSPAKQRRTRRALERIRYIPIESIKKYENCLFSLRTIVIRFHRVNSNLPAFRCRDTERIAPHSGEREGNFEW